MSDANLVHAIEFLTVCAVLFGLGFASGSRLVFSRRQGEEEWEREQKRRRASL